MKAKNHPSVKVLKEEIKLLKKLRKKQKLRLILLKDSIKGRKTKKKVFEAFRAVDIKSHTITVWK